MADRAGAGIGRLHSSEMERQHRHPGEVGNALGSLSGSAVYGSDITGYEARETNHERGERVCQPYVVALPTNQAAISAMATGRERKVGHWPDDAIS